VGVGAGEEEESLVKGGVAMVENLWSHWGLVFGIGKGMFYGLLLGFV